MSKSKSKPEVRSSKSELPKPPALPVKVVTTLDDLVAAFDEPIVVELALGRQHIQAPPPGWPANLPAPAHPFESRSVLRITGRMLRPEEVQPVRELMEEQLPPEKPREVDDEGRPKGPVLYDTRDPKWLKEREDRRRLGRALALWCGFGFFKEAFEKRKQPVEGPPSPQPSPPGRGGSAVAVDRQEILRFMESLAIDEDCLDLMYGQLMAQKVGLLQALNFTSAGTSPAG